MEIVKAKRLNARARKKLEDRLSKDETIRLLYNNNQNSWVNWKSIARCNTDSMLLVDSALRVIKDADLLDTLIRDFSKEREEFIGSKND